MPSLAPEDFLRQQLSPAPREGSRLDQLCVTDHSDQVEPHIHVQAHVRHTGPSPDRIVTSRWQRFDGISVSDLRAAVCRVAGEQVRFHMHEDADQNKPVAKEFLELLWSCSTVLHEEEVAALVAQDESSCPICLGELQAGEEMVCLPCEGMHSGHWQCFHPWLQKASTCPCCRFELPVTSDDKDKFAPLIEQSLAALSKLKANAHEQSSVSSITAARLERSQSWGDPSRPAVTGSRTPPRRAEHGEPDRAATQPMLSEGEEAVASTRTAPGRRSRTKYIRRGLFELTRRMVSTSPS
jgi:hypothetical protein